MSKRFENPTKETSISATAGYYVVALFMGGASIFALLSFPRLGWVVAGAAITGIVALAMASYAVGVVVNTVNELRSYRLGSEDASAGAVYNTRTQSIVAAPKQSIT